MRLAMMQPYFFPYLGYFSLIAATDRFVVFDPVQYIRHGWINRNRILKPGFADAQYVNVPLAKHSRASTIREIRVANQQPWKQRILGQIQHYRKVTPHFRMVRSMLERCFEIETDRIVDLNVHCLRIVCELLQLELKLTMFSEIESEVGEVNGAGEWALRTAVAIGADAYLNPGGGRELFDPAKFRDHQIQLGFVESSLPNYPQRNDAFVAGLSILDVLMFNGVDGTRKLIDDYEISFV